MLQSREQPLNAPVLYKIQPSDFGLYMYHESSMNLYLGMAVHTSRLVVEKGGLMELSGLYRPVLFSVRSDMLHTIHGLFPSM